jgi:transcriptional regulator with XRE-family HTH domain
MSAVKSAMPIAKHVEIGGRIREIRLLRKLRQVDLASSAGISWRHLIRMEQGEGGEPKSETLDRIADALGVSRTDLTGSDDDEEAAAMQPLGGDIMQALNAAIDRAVAVRMAALAAAERKHEVQR